MYVLHTTSGESENVSFYLDSVTYAELSIDHAELIILVRTYILLYLETCTR